MRAGLTRIGISEGMNMGRTPIRATPVREPIEAGPVKTRLRKKASQRSLLDIDINIINKIRDDFGMDLQWVTHSVHGKEEAAMRQDFEINGWEPVDPNMFDRVFDGMFTRKGHQGEIQYNGLVLMYRPYELTEEAMAEDRQSRNNAMESVRRMITDGEIPGIGAGFSRNHPTARSETKFNRTVRAPIDIPTD